MTTVICDKCRRIVVPEHVCDGSARSTCVMFGCGRPVVETSVVEIDDTGRHATLGSCAAHSYQDDPK